MAHPATTCIPAPAPSMGLLYQAADEVMEYSALAQVCTPRPTDIDALTTLADRREVTLRRMVNTRDTHDALEYLHERNEFPDHFWSRLEEVELEFAEKRLNRSQA